MVSSSSSESESAAEPLVVLISRQAASLDRFKTEVRNWFAVTMVSTTSRRMLDELRENFNWHVRTFSKVCKIYLACHTDFSYISAFEPDTPLVVPVFPLSPL